jgi:hypothetical protein
MTEDSDRSYVSHEYIQSMTSLTSVMPTKALAETETKDDFAWPCRSRVASQNSFANE